MDDDKKLQEEIQKANKAYIDHHTMAMKFLGIAEYLQGKLNERDNGNKKNNTSDSSKS